MKKIIILFSLIFLAVILQLSVFSAWSFSLRGLIASPQLFVIISAFLLFNLKESYLWWFVFLFYLVFDLITGSKLPGLNPLLIMAFLLFTKYLHARLFKKSLFSGILFFVLFSSFHHFLNYQKLDFFTFTFQSLTNLVFFILFYPILFVISKFIQKDSDTQLSLRL